MSRSRLPCLGSHGPLEAVRGIFINLVHQAHTYCKTVANPR